MKDSEAESKGLTNRLNKELERLKEDYYDQVESTKNVSTHREIQLASKEDELDEALYKLALLAKKFDVKKSQFNLIFRSKRPSYHPSETRQTRLTGSLRRQSARRGKPSYL